MYRCASFTVLCVIDSQSDVPDFGLHVATSPRWRRTKRAGNTTEDLARYFMYPIVNFRRLRSISTLEAPTAGNTIRCSSSYGYIVEHVCVEQ